MKLDYPDMPGCALCTSWDLEIPFFTGKTTRSATFPVRWDPSDFDCRTRARQKNANHARVEFEPSHRWTPVEGQWTT